MVDLLHFFCTHCPCQPNATTMRTTARVIVNPCKIPENFVKSISAQHKAMADAPDSKSGPRKRVWVQVPPSVVYTYGKSQPADLP